LEELACHFLDIRLQEDRRRRYLQRYPWRMNGQRLRQDLGRLEERRRDPSKIAADLLTTVSLEDSDLDD
jgi:hypothetical protein